MEALGRAAELDVVVHGHRRCLLEANPYVRSVHGYRNNPFTRLALAARLAAAKYDEVVILHANDDILRLLPRLRYGEACNIQGWNRPELKLSDMDLKGVGHVVIRRLEMLRKMGIPAEDLQPDLHLRNSELAEADEWLAERGLGPGLPLAALAPGGSRAFKMWPTESFGRLAARLAEHGFRPFILGSAAEAPLGREVGRAAGRELVQALGLPLRLSAALLSRVSLLVTNDSGPLHLGHAAGAPLVGIYGPTDPERVGPLTGTHRLVRAEPCSSRCAQTGPGTCCLRKLSCDRVWAAAQEMLEGGAGP
jgi:ADP-heptose:LPS heptosyltransferase